MNTTLLQQEIRVLRTENEQKTKKNAGKQASIGDNLFISIQEGRGRIQQLNTQDEAQVEEYISASQASSTTLQWQWDCRTYDKKFPST